MQISLHFEAPVQPERSSAALAQLVEQHFCKVKVPGSSPGGGSKNKTRRKPVFCFCARLPDLNGRESHVDHRLPNRCYAYRMASCLSCLCELKNRWQLKYCSNKCQADFQYQECIREWKANSQGSRQRVATQNISKHLKRYLVETNGEKCSLCGWNKKHPITKRVPLEVDHIDGNAENNHESNLRIICPNCHALTVHFRNLNRTRGRKWRTSAGT